MKRIIISLISLLASSVLFAQTPVWVLGQWSDGECIYEIAPDTIYLLKGDKTVDQSAYDFDGSFISVQGWKNGLGEESFIINGNVIAIEGGDNLKKVSSKYRMAGGDSLKGYEWLAGKWVTEDYLKGKNEEMYNTVIITPAYFQQASFFSDMEVITNVESKEKTTFTITVSESDFAKGIKTIADEYYIDPARKQIYWLYDFDQKKYMKKVE